MKYITKIFDKLGFVPKSKNSSNHNKSQERVQQERIQKVLDYTNSISWSTRDFLHYLGDDISKGRYMSKENGLILSLVGGNYQKQYINDIDRLRGIYSTPSILNREDDEFVKFGIDSLLKMPAKYWIEFCIQLVDKDDKEASLSFVGTRYLEDKKHSIIAPYLPPYGKIVVSKYDGDFVSLYIEGKALPKGTEVVNYDEKNNYSMKV